MTHPQHPIPHTPHPVSYLKGFLWFTFSGTAMLSAFILPIHVWALAHGYAMNLSNIFFRLYFLVLFIAALYHGLYRAKTILFDLGLGKYQKAIDTIATITFLVSLGLTVKLFLLW